MSNPLNVVGSVFGAFGALQQGKAQSDSYRASAQMNEFNASIVESQAAEEVMRQQRQATKVRGAASAARAASGLKSDDNIDIAWENSLQSELEAKSIKYNAELQAKSYRLQGAADNRAAKNARTTSYFNAASSLVGGFKP